MKPFIITFIGILVGLGVTILGLTGSPAPVVVELSILASLITLLGAWMQFRDSRPFELIVNEKTWETETDGARITITRRQHRKKAPTLTIFSGKHPNFELVICANSIDSSGTVAVSCTRAFAGKIVVK